MRTRASLVGAGLMWLAAHGVGPSASAQAPAPGRDTITYQGRITDRGAPANGAYDIQFSLFAADSGGTALLTVTKLNISAASGLFTTPLDFGDQFFAGARRRWVELAVRRTADGGAYTTLAPRQELTATPFAISLRLPFFDNVEVDDPTAAFRMTSIGTGTAIVGRSKKKGIVASASPDDLTRAPEAPAQQTAAEGGDTFAAAGAGVIGDFRGAGGSILPVVGLDSLAQRGPDGVVYTPAAELAADTGGRFLSARSPNHQYLPETPMNIGVYAEGADRGTCGFSPSGLGVNGKTFDGVGVQGESTSAMGLAGKFVGNVLIQGNISATGMKMFKIDHPLDPSNKTLAHASVESDEMMDLYRGNSVLDERGEATVALPEWFEALNQDFTYSLTPIGAAAPDLHVAREVDHNRFAIAGGRPGMKVSWSVAGARHDAEAVRHPLIVEQEKPIATLGAAGRGARIGEAVRHD